MVYKYTFILHSGMKQNACMYFCLFLFSAAFTTFIQKLFYCLPQDNSHSLTD